MDSGCQTAVPLEYETNIAMNNWSMMFLGKHLSSVVNYIIGQHSNLYLVQ